ncbi:hypothetical protein HanRHA438_Chr08g0345801 [Helianthus annuus]|nr:hypothetical protein HanOQP8_Chr08g0282871 [Helianthus annuus]KAJ0897442.1 hypothetical protein HanRHA438_Chr08g0345801 [Helianthus annuus]
MSSSESGLSEEHDPMAIVSGDEVAPIPEVLASDTDSDPKMLSEDDDDFQPFALPDFGDDVPIADGIPVEDLFDFSAPIHDHPIIGHPDGEHIVAPILDVVPLVAAGLQLYATDSDDDTAMSAAPLSPALVPTPPHVPEPVPEPDLVPFGQPYIAPLIPEPIPAPLDLPLVDPYIPPPPSADVAPPPPVISDAHRTDLPIIFLQEIPAPRPGEGTSGQPPRFDPFASADFPLIPQTTPFTPFTSASLDEPFRRFPPYTMPISDPFHPSHYVGYTRDELLLSLQLQFEILSRRVLELELGEGAR